MQNKYFNNDGEDTSLTSSCPRSWLEKWNPVKTKVALGGGHKRFQWVGWLYPILLDAFELFKKPEIKFFFKSLLEIVHELLMTRGSKYLR